MVHKHRPEIQTGIVINPISTDGDTWHDYAVDAFDELGLQLVDTARYQLGTVDFYPILTPLVAQNPDVIDFGFAPPGDAGVLLKQTRELGYMGWVSLSAGAGTSQTRAIAGDANLWNVLMNDPDLCSPVYPAQACDLLNEWREVYAENPRDSMMRTPTMGYDAMMMFATAIEQAGSIDTDEVMKVLDDPTFRFPSVVSEETALGGWETYGIRRQAPLNDDYGEIIDADNINLSIDLTITNVP
jgi:ABC-type branched-subunit amino acid transport system substrate-binding protein